MREILFKAKRLDSRDWVEGFFWKDIWGDGESCYILYDGEDYAVDPSTVCQYTGLTDSDGKRVFDGDILKFRDEPNDYEWVGRVEFGNPNGGYTWGWQLVHISGPEPNIDTLCWFDMEEAGAYSHIIGNIHDGEGGDSERVQTPSP